jgi:competence ComEA-like helix-hairpin-helix protein
LGLLRRFAPAGIRGVCSRREKSACTNRHQCRIREELPGIGPAAAKAIVRFRTEWGRFDRVEDLPAIPGISETKLSKIRPYITIGAAPAAKKTSPTPTSPPANH